MRLQRITCDAFGPFVGETLELAPGMNVVYGPNESGKSTWHAAIQAALCGMKRSRGRSSRDDQDFTERHRPWNARSWKVSAVVDLDDGTAIEVIQRLGRGGASSATLVDSGRAATDRFLHDGAVDLLTELGLSRETATATIFVRQADMLRVLEDAGALQDHLERAAASGAVDTTADEALERIARFRREQVGVLRSNAQGPLAVATRRLQQASQALDEAESRYERYQGQLGERRHAERDLANKQRLLDELMDHERDRGRRLAWVALGQAEAKLEQARHIRAELDAVRSEVIPEREVVAEAARALAAFDARPAPPSPLDGPSSAELEAELAALPEVPDDDVEPRPDVVAGRDRWRALTQQLLAHEDHEPPGTPPPVVSAGPGTAAEIEAELEAVPGLPVGDLEPATEVTVARDRWHQDRARAASHLESEPEPVATVEIGLPEPELRRLIGEIEAPVPAVDSQLAQQVGRRRAEVEATHAEREAASSRVPKPSSVSVVALVVGGCLLAGGLASLVAGVPAVGVIALLVGIALLVLGGVLRTRRPTGPPRPEAAGDQQLARLESNLASQQSAAEQGRQRHDQAIARVAAAGMPGEPAQLRALLAQHEAAGSQGQAILAWARRNAELAQTAEAAEAILRSLLVDRGVVVGEDLDAAFVTYIEECRARSQVARVADRRADLESRLAERRGVEEAAEASRLRHEEWRRRGDELAAQLSVARDHLLAQLAERGVERHDGEVEAAFARYEDDCRKRAQVARQAARRLDVAAQLEARRHAEAARQAEVEVRSKAERELLAVAAAISISPELDPLAAAEAVREWLATEEAARGRRQAQAEATGRLEELLGGRSLDEIAAELAARQSELGAVPADLAPLKDRSSDVASAQAAVRSSRDRVAELTGQLETSVHQLIDVSAAVEEEAEAQADRNRVEQLADDLDRASAILTAAQAKVHADIAPVLSGTIRPWVPMVTAGRYDDVRVDPASLRIEARGPDGLYRSASLLSQGTTEQLFLLLRLALAEHLATGPEAAPVILDDVTVQSDARRTGAILDLLHAVSCDRQVVLFSQEDEVAAWAECSLTGDRDALVRLRAPG